MLNRPNKPEPKKTALKMGGTLVRRAIEMLHKDDAPVTKKKLERRIAEEPKKEPVRKLQRRGEDLPEIKPKRFKRKLHRRGTEPKRLNRLRRYTIHVHPHVPTCYVCGEEIGAEYEKIKKKDSSTGKMKTTHYRMEPLCVGKNDDGIKVYRHRSKRCMPFSKTYMKLLAPAVRKDLMRAYREQIRRKDELESMARISELISKGGVDDD